MRLARVVVLVVVAAAALGGCKRARPADGPAPTRPKPLACADLQGCVDACRAGDARCVDACVARLTAAARPYYDTLQACVAPACASADAGAAPCREATSFACKLCVMARCAGAASACLAH